MRPKQKSRLENIPLMRPWVGDEEAKAVARVLTSGWLSQGEEVAAFEREFGEYVGAAHACAVSSCTAALHLALRAVGVGAGDEVVTVSSSFIATANSIAYFGAVPVFVDIEPDGCNMDVGQLAAAIGPKTRAILCVHQMGMPCDLARIAEIARSAKIPVIEDAACAIGSEFSTKQGWEKIGQPHADIACFSFHPRKILTCGDGGMLTTSNPEWDAMFRRWRQHGMSLSDLERHRAASTRFESYLDVGYNYRLTDIQAAVGRVQLKRLGEMLQVRQKMAQQYTEALQGVQGMRCLETPRWARTNFQSFPLHLPDGVGQRQVMDRLLQEQIATRRGIMCAHREPAYRKLPWRCTSPKKCDHAVGRCINLSHSESSQDHSILLPLYHTMTESQVERVCAALKQAVE